MSIYLASRSPRRRELLNQIGVKFEPLLFREGARADADTSEAVTPGESPDDYVRRVARMKAEAAWQRGRDAPRPAEQAGACGRHDRGVDGTILGKPADKVDAERMLRMLSGTRHRVLTAVALRFEDRFEMTVSDSFVTFSALDDERIATYVQSGEPFDKAGAYAIQGRAGAFVERIEGSYSGIMGLPLFETVSLLRQFGIVVP